MDFPFDGQKTSGSQKSNIEEAGTLYHQTCSVKHVLGILRKDAEGIVEAQPQNEEDPVKKIIVDEKKQLLEKILEKVTVGEGETHILSTLARYLELLDLERYRYALQVKRLSDENSWLKEENKVYNEYKTTLTADLNQANSHKEYYNYIYHNRNLDAAQVPLFKMGTEQIMDDAGWCNIDVHDLENSEKAIPSQLRAVYKLIMQNMASNNFALCHKLLNEIIKRTEKSSGAVSADVAYLHDIKALVYRKEKRLIDTNKHLLAACEIREKLFGKVSLQVATTMNNISICSSKLGNFSEAEKACRKALEIRRKVCGNNHPQVVKQLHNLGLICTFLSKFDESLSLFEEALRALSSSDDHDTLDNLRVQSSIAMCHLRSNDLVSAEKAMISICRDYHMYVKGHRSDPLIDPDIWMIINNHNTKPARTVELLVEEFDVIGRHDILYVVAKNLYTFFGKQSQATKQKIVQDWLNLKPGDVPSPKKLEAHDSRQDLSNIQDDRSGRSVSEATQSKSVNVTSANSSTSLKINKGGVSSEDSTSVTKSSGVTKHVLKPSSKSDATTKRRGVMDLFKRKK